MRKDLLILAAELSRRGEPFALATVVRREPPSSAHTGDSALITADGRFHGWLGGSCTEPTVVREARHALLEARPRLIALAPEPDPVARPGVTQLPMTCHSGGRVDVYIEPVLPAPALLVFGVSPAARALARIGSVLGQTVVAVDPEADAGAFPEADLVVTDYTAPELGQALSEAPGAAVVATLGERDEEALRHALALRPDYVGLVASRKRFREMTRVLADRGVDREAMERVHCPAGLDLGAVTPGEIALTIMAEIVQRRRAAAADVRPTTQEAGASPDSEPASPPDLVTTDPVCGMTVDPATAKHRAEYGGLTYLFCSGGCRERFLADPVRYVGAVAGEES